MRLSVVEERLRALAPRRSPRGDERAAAVLVPLYEQGGELYVVLGKRSEEVPHHKGQISFPGGTCRDDDASLEATALREAEEEIGLPPEDVSIIGRLDELITITDFHVTPFVAAIAPRAALRPEGREIVEILHVPLSHLADPRNARTKALPGRDEVVYFYDFGAHVIWGATGRILHQLLAILAPEETP